MERSHIEEDSINHIAQSKNNSSINDVVDVSNILIKMNKSIKKENVDYSLDINNRNSYNTNNKNNEEISKELIRNEDNLCITDKPRSNSTLIQQTFTIAQLIESLESNYYIFNLLLKIIIS